jgi:predicted hydrolase (HD superfamily)
MLTREEGWARLCEWTAGESLRKHARAVEIVMRAAAHRFGEGAGDEERWGLAGLLHDADYERWPEEHPTHTVAWLRERGEEDIAYAVSAHYTRWQVPHRCALDRALLACDELTGFVVAACLVRPDGIATISPTSVVKKLKDKAFAAKVERSEIAAGAALLGVETADLAGFVIEALKPHAAELGIGPAAERGHGVGR